MATAQVRQMHEANGRKVLVIDRRGAPQWHPVFEGNPRIARIPRPGVQRLVNCSGHRPYIVSKSPTHWTWRRWRIEPGEIYLTPQEASFGQQHAGQVLIEPHTKVPGSNKAWPWDRWQQFANDHPGRLVQVGPAGTRVLDGVRFIETADFRMACAVLRYSMAFVGTEGGLHHAAAALGVQAVVLFSEFISPDITGYPMHRNLRRAGPACGARQPCPTCAESMRAITVDEVSTQLEEITR